MTNEPRPSLENVMRRTHVFVYSMAKVLPALYPREWDAVKKYVCSLDITDVAVEHNALWLRFGQVFDCTDLNTMLITIIAHYVYHLL